MTNLASIRVRLALWYLAILGIGMVLFAASIFVAVRYELIEGVHESLTERLRSFELFLELESHGTDIPALREEAREYSTGLPAGDTLRVRSGDGQIIYESSPAGPRPVQDSYEISERIKVHGHDLTVEMTAPLGQVYETLSLLRNALFLCVPLMLAVAVLGGTWIAKRALRTVDDITADAQSISMNELSRRLVVPKTGDELERLSLAWNTMLDRLAAAVNQMKRFTTDAAHELRTPVAIIRSTAEVALRKDRDSNSYRTALSSIQQETIHLTGLVEELMWLARHDSGTPGGHREDIAVEVAVRSACQAVTALAEERGVSLEVRVDEGSTVHVDPIAFRRLLLILLDNALKFTPAQQRVKAIVGNGNGRVRIEIHDRGGGIPEEHRDHIFERFYRADTARTSSGFGLGLSIAKAIVEAHGGSIGVETADGVGSCFYVELPRAGSGGQND